MGLDGVELLMAVEEEFQIAVSNEDASRCETPAQLADLVYSKLRTSRRKNCPSQHGFNIIRKRLIEFFAIPREKILPETKIKVLIPRKGRKSAWKEFLKLLSDGKTIYAPLERPQWVKSLVWALSAVASLIALIMLDNLVLSVCAAFLVGIAVHTMTFPLEMEFPKGFSTVKDLVRIVRTLDSAVWNQYEVYEHVKQIVVEQLGVKISDVQPNSHFVDDLGMG